MWIESISYLVYVWFAYNMCNCVQVGEAGEAGGLMLRAAQRTTHDTRFCGPGLSCNPSHALSQPGVGLARRFAAAAAGGRGGGGAHRRQQRPRQAGHDGATGRRGAESGHKGRSNVLSRGVPKRRPGGGQGGGETAAPSIIGGAYPGGGGGRGSGEGKRGGKTRRADIDALREEILGGRLGRGGGGADGSAKRQPRAPVAAAPQGGGRSQPVDSATRAANRSRAVAASNAEAKAATVKRARQRQQLRPRDPSLAAKAPAGGVAPPAAPVVSSLGTGSIIDGLGGGDTGVSHSPAADTSSPDTSQTGQSLMQALSKEREERERESLQRMKEQFAKIRRDREAKRREMQQQQADEKKARAEATDVVRQRPHRVRRRRVGSGRRAQPTGASGVWGSPRKFLPRRQRRNLQLLDREVYLDEEMTVRELAKRMGVGVGRLLRKMNDLGEEHDGPDSPVSMDSGEVLVLEFGLTPDRADQQFPMLEPSELPTSEAELAKLPARSAVVTLMGHVDHGKTTLLDCLRAANVAAGEAGGITQSIGAFRVNLLEPHHVVTEVSNAKSKKGKGKPKAKKSKAKKRAAARKNASTDPEDQVTFVDTPGHALFSSMRERGAALTDIVILVVAADDGVKPQTEECIDVAMASGASIIVAVTKADVVPDVEEAVARIESQLLDLGLQTENTGGECPVVAVSATTGEGIDDLKENLRLVAEISELKAPYDEPGEAVVLEAEQVKGLGPTADVIVRWGTLRVGDNIVCGTLFGRVKALVDDSGTRIKQAPPSTPVRVVGLRGLPSSGADLLVAPDEETAREVVEGRAVRETYERIKASSVHLEARREIEAEGQKREKKLLRLRRTFDFRERMRARKIAVGEDLPDEMLEGHRGLQAAIAALEREQEEFAKRHATVAEPMQVPLVLRAATSGALTSITEATAALPQDEVVGKFVHSDVGDVTLGDVELASFTGAAIVAFDSKVSAQVAKAAERSDVPVFRSRIIYECMANVADHLASFMSPTEDEVVVGRAEVLEVFKIRGRGGDTSEVAGCRVVEGSFNLKARYRVMRDGEVVADVASLASLRHFQDEVQEVTKGQECGVGLSGWEGVRQGDRIVAYVVESSEPKLDVDYLR